jgi:hypothetical protein
VALTDHLSPRQVQTLAALVDTIVPADDYPSGTEAGVLDHLDRHFAADLAAARHSYRLGLDGLDAESRAVHDRPFPALRPRQREGLLRTIESHRERGRWAVDPRAFLADAVTHVMEGFYGDPVAWEMVGFRVTD